MVRRTSRKGTFSISRGMMVMMVQMSSDDWDEKSEKKNDQDEVDGMK